MFVGFRSYPGLCSLRQVGNGVHERPVRICRIGVGRAGSFKADNPPLNGFRTQTARVSTASVVRGYYILLGRHEAI